MQHKGCNMSEVCRQRGVTDNKHYRWSKEHPQRSGKGSERAESAPTTTEASQTVAE